MNIRALPSRPPSVAEWEELLLRFEIMPRALRVTLEEAGGPRAASLLADHLAAEAETLDWLQRAAGYSAAERGGAGGGGIGEATTDPLRMADRFASLRARNFAMLQRRGLAVWEWSAPLPSGEAVTAYQVVTARVLGDAQTLARLRDGTRLGAGAC